MNLPTEQDASGVGRLPRVEIIVTENFDTESVPRMDDLLNQALALNPAELVVDLGNCPLVDAAAIGLLVDVHRRVRRAGGELTLRSPSLRLRRNLRLARVDQVLRVTPVEPPESDPVPAESDPEPAEGSPA